MKAVVGVALAIALGGCLVSPVMSFGSGKTAKQAQRAQAARLAPPGFAVDEEWTGDVAIAKVRVWADDEYRAQNIGWQQAFRRDLEHVNEVLAAQFGVRLVPELEAWNYRAAPGAPLSDGLAALALHDIAEGADFVIGLTGALSLVASSFEQIGIANLGGRHLMLRGFADRVERAAFDRSFPDLPDDEKRKLFGARRRHKVAAVLLHELGHNLGAPHFAGADSLMSPQYSHRAASFDADSRRQVMAGLDARLRRTPRATASTAPRSRSSAPIPLPSDLHPTLVVVIDANGRRMVGGNTLDDDTLDGLLKLSFDDDKDTSILVQARAGAPQAVVTAVVDRARTIGLARVTVATAP